MAGPQEVQLQLTQPGIFQIKSRLCLLIVHFLILKYQVNAVCLAGVLGFYTSLSAATGLLKMTNAIQRQNNALRSRLATLWMKSLTAFQLSQLELLQDYLKLIIRSLNGRPSTSACASFMKLRPSTMLSLTRKKTSNIKYKMQLKAAQQGK